MGSFTFEKDMEPIGSAGPGGHRTPKLPSFPGADRPLLDQYATAFEKVLSHASRLPR